MTTASPSTATIRFDETLLQPLAAVDPAIADILRYRMYCDNYGDRERARRLFAELPAAARAAQGVDLSAAESACPFGLPVADLVRDALGKLA